MKRLLLISWFLLFLFSCRKEEILPVPPPKPEVDIFTITESEVSDGEEIMFKLYSDSTYTLKLVDKVNGQVLSKEKIKGINGANKIKIYTKSLPAKYLYLVLEDGNKKEMNKTTIIAK